MPADEPHRAGTASEHRAIAVKRDAEVIFDIEKDFCELYKSVHQKTMTNFENLYNMYCSTNYIVDAGVPGAIVECGVWRGGCMMLSAQQLIRRHATARDLWLFDTFEGMTPPDERDFKYVLAQDGGLASRYAQPTWEAQQREGGSDWCYAPLEEVRGNLESTGYPVDRMHFVKGDVAETLAATVPDQIALLRLDTDWYESTRVELERLWPRLSIGGVIIIDDYGGWRGQRQAVDEYFAQHGSVMLHRISRNCRSGVKHR